MHWQYVKGEASPEYLGQSNQMYYTKGSSGDAGWVAIVISVISCVGVVAGWGYVFHWKRKSDDEKILLLQK